MMRRKLYLRPTHMFGLVEGCVTSTIAWHCMETFSAKRRRQNRKLIGLLGDPTVSLDSIHRIVSQLGTDEVPHSKYALSKTYRERFNHVRHTETLINKVGGEAHWNFCEPGRLLQLSLIHISEPTRPY